jgi:hypothetical protein
LTDSSTWSVCVQFYDGSIKVIILQILLADILLFSLGQVWINSSDIILVGLRDYQVIIMRDKNQQWFVFFNDNDNTLLHSSLKDQKADVILKYNADEARSLKAYGELPEHGKYLGPTCFSTTECSAMKSQLTFTSEVLTCYYYFTLFVIYEHLIILKTDLALMAMYSYDYGHMCTL